MSREAKIGSLWKEEAGLLAQGRSWKRRCLLLDGAVLYSFRQAPNLVPQGRIVLKDAQVQVRPEQASIFLTVVADSRIYQLEAENLAEMNDWGRALQLSGSDSEAPVLKMGFLRKSVLGGWGSPKRQWFVLDRDALFFFKQPPEFSPAEALQLDRSMAVEASQRASCCFEMTGHGCRGWCLKADTEEARDDWVHAINQALYQLEASAGPGLPPATQRQGWLQKQSEHLGMWNPRYVTLHGEVMHYFTRPNDAVPRGSVRLLGATVLPLAGSSDFSVTTTERTMMLRADSRDEADAWCAALREGIAHAQDMSERLRAVSMGALSSLGAPAVPAPSSALSPAAQNGTRRPPPPERANSALHALSLAPTGTAAGPCISLAVFDNDAASGSGVCANCTPQAARWQCNALLVTAFDVAWRRVPPAALASGAALQLAPIVQTEVVHVAASSAPPADGSVQLEDVYSSYLPSIDDIGCLLQACAPPATPGTNAAPRCSARQPPHRPRRRRSSTCHATTPALQRRRRARR